MKNIITLTDSYKVTHYKQYPDGTDKVYSYFEARNGAKFNKTLFFGLQYLLKEYLEGFVVDKRRIEMAANLCKSHFGTDEYFNYEMWDHILTEHKGKLPLEIKAVPEGTLVPVNNVMMTVENTDPKCWALTNYVETLLTHVWSSSTVATLSYEVKLLCKTYLDWTSDDEVSQAHLQFMLHDFGFRGVSSVESAAICGAGHLINFMGTDTLVSMECAMDYYGADVNGLAYSVAATEHSIMTSMGRDKEGELVESLIDKYQNGILSLVIDSYDYQNFITVIARNLKNKINARNGKTVFRPDSGEPVSTSLDVMERLGDVFGYTKNTKGFKILPDNIGMIYGDGLDYSLIRDILHALKEAGWASSNCCFGMGGGLLQQVNRDTQRFAFKSSAQRRDGVWYDIFKQPLDVSKMSKRGKLVLVKDNDNNYTTYRKEDAPDGYENVLKTVFLNGEIVNEYSFNDVRSNVSV